MQVIGKFRHGYVRYEALLSRLALAQRTAAPEGGARPALAHFAAAAAEGLSGAGCHTGGPPPGRQNGRHPAAAASGDPFVASLAAEAQRVRHFISAHLEELWVQLLDLVRQLQGVAKSGGGAAEQAGDALRRIEATLDAFGGWPLLARPRCCGGVASSTAASVGQKWCMPILLLH